MKTVSGLLMGIGVGFVLVSVGLLVMVLGPVAQVEWEYQAHKSQEVVEEVEPVDNEFGLVVPKIGANAKVIRDVDPFSSQIYQQALTKGVAHAAGSALPGERGSVFIFSHSSVNFYEASRYNSIFYLLNKLARGDEILIYFEGEEYRYMVSGKKIVDGSEVEYLNDGENGLILMTCWPPGTSLKRLLVFAKNK